MSVGFIGSPNADILARSATGLVASTLPGFAPATVTFYRRALARAPKHCALTPQSGAVSLALITEGNELSNRVIDEGQPGQEAPRKPAGTPAPALDTQEVSEGDVIRVDSQLVTLNMSVVDRNTSRGLVGLTKSDFRLFENGSEQQILQFESSSAPFDLMLLIDLSGSTRDVVSLIRAAALRFINAARPFDRIGVITFARQANRGLPLTLDRQAAAPTS